MSNDINQKDPQDQENEKQPEKVTPSAADSKNSAVTGGGIPNPTDRVKPGAGDGLANEGTVVSYEEER